MRFGDSSKAHASKYITVYPVIILKALDRTHLQGRKSDKAPKYDGYHLLFTFLFISAPTWNKGGLALPLFTCHFDTCYYDLLKKKIEISRLSH